ncbi:AAA family ATPase [Sporosarcina sp. SAFN-015]|uniref:AAA family ATPase n=1 Tax=Sporosarcina sp. SAFN-015 TaxID=3387274 RepID=UPI003F81504D
MENDLSKLDEIINALNNRFYEREAEIEAILIAVLARQHILIIGPSGTAKSALVTALAKIIQGTKYFQWLLTRFSTPEELFGPLSLKDLERGVYKRNTETKMPEADIAFLDEIFKANSAILNSLLTIINERVFYNDGMPIQVPLMSVIGASNEFPEEGEGLDALFDRFLLRFEIEYIVEDTNFIFMMKNAGRHMQLPTVTMEELTRLQFLTERVVIQDEVYTAILKIRKELRDEGIQPSDRRFQQSLSLLQARALIRKREVVLVDDIIILEHVLWERVEQRDTVSFIVRRHAQDTVIQKLDSIQTEAIEIINMILQDNSVEAKMEANQKINALDLELNELKKSHRERESEINVLHSKVKSMQQEILNSILEPMYFNGENVKGVFW